MLCWLLLGLQRDDEEHKAKSELGQGFLGGRECLDWIEHTHADRPSPWFSFPIGQAALKKYSLHPEAEPHKAFYDEKIASNGAFLTLYQGKASKDEFFAQSHTHFHNIATFFKESLVSYLPENGFICGEIPGEGTYVLRRCCIFF